MSVYANGLEIAGKAKGGKSMACSPDPCFSPPSPSAGWIVIPYANTTKAKDTKNASKTVFIEGKPVMLKDKSYFKTSTGNEGAAGPKGLSTGVKKGKAFFTSWSMDIKVEGYNVCRHTDGMTHNHGSTGNTTVWHYNDGKSDLPPKECYQDCVDIEEACGNHDCKGDCRRKKIEATCGKKPPKKPKEPSDKKAQQTYEKEKKAYDDEQPKAVAENARKRGVVAEVKKMLKKNDIELPMGETWKMNAMSGCTSCAMIKPGCDPRKQVERILDQKEKLKRSIKNLKEKLNDNWSDRISALLDAAELDTVDTVQMVIEKYLKIDKLKKVFGGADVIDHIDEIRDVIGKAWGEAQQAIEHLDDLSQILDNYKKEDADSIMATLEHCAGRSCLKARKCLLEPYDKSKMPGTLFSNEGCCPGQTAHHLIPNSMYQSKRNSNSSNVPGCKDKGKKKGYRHDKAPNVCVEGNAQNDEKTSHGEIHKYTKEELQDILDDETLSMTYHDAKKAAVTAHQRTFPGSNCSEGCIGAQLDAYRDEACGKGTNPFLRKKDGMTKKFYAGPEDGTKPANGEEDDDNDNTCLQDSE